MEKYVIQGEQKLIGQTHVSGAKNVALKALVAACLTTDKVVIKNIPLISDFFAMAEIIEEIGGSVRISGHSATVHIPHIKSHAISLEKAAQTRTSSMFLAPLLLRKKEAVIPNPGGCRLGARPIDRTIEGLSKMGADITYNRKDGYFHAKSNGFHGIEYRFEKNTHTGTETLIIAAVLGKGKTILENAAEEPEIDELITLLNQMGAKIKRVKSRVIEIEGVKTLHGTEFTIQPDRNEIVTFAVAALITKGDVFVKDATTANLAHFLEAIHDAGGGYEEHTNGIRFFYKGKFHKTHITTGFYPAFMTDWQAPWAVLMTQAEGVSTVHETVFEHRFEYVSELKKMGAHIEFYNPESKSPKSFYNFNIQDDAEDNYHAIKVYGPKTLHNAVMKVSDLRAGATLVLGALAASGTSILFGIEHLDRGYEEFDKRLQSIGAHIERVKDE